MTTLRPSSTLTAPSVSASAPSRHSAAARAAEVRSGTRPRSAASADRLALGLPGPERDRGALAAQVRDGVALFLRGCGRAAG